jgi:hypothetical protein
MTEAWGYDHHMIHPMTALSSFRLGEARRNRVVE